MVSDILARDIARLHAISQLEYELQKHLSGDASLSVDIYPWDGTYRISVLVAKGDQPPMRLVHPMKGMFDVPDELIAQLMMIG